MVCQSFRHREHEPEQRKTMAEEYPHSDGWPDAATFASQQIQYMNFTGVSTLARRQHWCSRRQKVILPQQLTMAELFMLDMRPDLHKINVPVAVVSPFYAPDFARFNMTEEQKMGSTKSHKWYPKFEIDPA